MAPRPAIPATRPAGDGPTVSVIIPTYEDAAFVGDAIESVAAQTYGPLEAIIVDSSGVEWLAALAAETEWLRYTFQEPAGLAAARNHGIELATGEIVGFLDADDTWRPEKLTKQMEAVANGADVVYTDAYIDEAGQRRRLSALPVTDPDRHAVRFLYEGGVPISSVIARRACLVAEPFDEQLPAVEDRHLLVRLFAEYQPARVAEPLLVYTRREDSMSSDADRMYEAELRVLESLFERYPELARHETALRRKATYKYGKRLLRHGDRAAGRAALWQAIHQGSRDPRTLALFAVSLLPVDSRRSLWHLERLQEQLAT